MLTSKQKLKRERTDVAIAAIKNATASLEDQHFHNRAILLWQGINKNERDRGANLISQEAYSEEEHRINKALLLLIDDLPHDLFDNQAKVLPVPPLSPPAKAPFDFWKNLGYVALMVGILAGVVKIVEYFPKHSSTDKTEKTVVKPDSVATPSVQLNVKNGDAIYAPGGTVNTSRSSEVEKTAEKKAKN